MHKRIVKDINISQLPMGTLFKLGLLGNLYLWGILALVIGTLSAAGFDTVQLGGVSVHGLTGFATSIAVSAMMAFTGTLAFTASCLIARTVVRKFGGGALSYYEDHEAGPN